MLSDPIADMLTRLRNALAESDHDTARDALRVLAELVEESSTLTAPALKAARRGIAELEDALGTDAYWRASTWKRVAAIAAGPAANVLLTIVLFAVLFMTSGGRATTTVDEVVPDAPAAAIGLLPGDRIVEIDGEEVGARDISRTIGASAGDPLTLVVVRRGERVTLGPVTARRNEDGAYRLGFVLRGEGLTPVSAVGESFRVTGLVTKDIGGSLGRLVTGEGRKDIASPVGIVQGSSEAAKRGTDTFIWVLGLISLSIALLNLLPLLPLDGGHIAFAVVEGIRGRAVTREVYERVSVVGIALVLLLFVIGLSNDIPNIS